MSRDTAAAGSATGDSTRNAVAEIRRLLRAYALLAGCSDDERALIGPVSRHWIGAESERMVRLADLPRAALLSPRGREIMAVELYDDPDLGPEDIGPDALRRLAAASSIHINSNRLPKLEPTLNSAVLTGVILCGVQLYGAGGKGRGDIDNDLILAAMLQPAVGRGDRFTAFAVEQWQIVDAGLLSDRFGPRVAQQALALRDWTRRFCADLEADREPQPVPPPAMANALAALLCAQLRLTARAAGDRIFSHLTPAQISECDAAGLKVRGELAERPYLRRDYLRAEAALRLPGVDRSALREPLGNTLLIAVQDALEDSAKTARLVGRRGKAVHDVHLNLPLMEYYNAAESPDSLPTMHLAALEMMRYLDKCRRKSFTTMLGHAFQMTGILEQTMGPRLDPSVAAAALLHDVVEDGARNVSGYDQSLNKLRLRFGGPLAAMVSEVTDSNSHLDGPRKAQTTYQHPCLLQPRRQYDISRFTEMPLRPTDADTPYTLAGIQVKLVDTIATEDEGLRDPDLMGEWWRNSGIRIYWAQKVRGPIVAPLESRLVEELERAAEDPGYADSLTALRQETLDGLRELLLRALDSHDLYAAQNLLILGDEFELDPSEQSLLQQSFFDAGVAPADFAAELVEKRLCDDRLAPLYAEGDRAQVVLYRKAPGRPRDTQTLLEYRVSALQRQSLRRRLGVGPEHAGRLDQAMRAVCEHYRRLCPSGTDGIRPVRQAVAP